MDDLSPTKSECVGLIVHAIIFQDLQPIVSEHIKFVRISAAFTADEGDEPACSS